MTTGHPNETIIGFDDFHDEVKARPNIEFDRGREIGLGKTSERYLAAALDEPRWALPDSTSAAQVLRRSLKTCGPFFLTDLVALVIAGLFAAGVARFVVPESFGTVGWAAPAAVALLLAAYWLAGLYCEVWIHPVVELRQIIGLNTLVFISAAVGGLTSLSLALWCAVAWCGAFVMVPLFRVVIRHVLSRCTWWGYPTLIIGSGSGADALASTLLKTPHCSLRPAMITDPEGVCRCGVLPVVNDPNTLESLLKAEGIRHAVFSLPEFSSTQQQRMLDHYGRWVPHLLVLSDTTTLPALWGAAHNDGRLSGLEIRNGLRVATMQFAKRIVDLAIALAVLPIAVALTVVLAAFTRASGPGALFYGHERIGQHGRRFKVWKFRTMHRDSDRMLREHLAANPEARIEWELQHKLRDDPRVTPIGKWLRKTSLDELPQIWNVIKGNMSLVGPRPIVQDEVLRYRNSIDRYAAVKPGITGLWQVSGRTDVSYAERVELDVFYIRHWSPWLDIYILAKTVVTLLKRRGAY